MADHLQCGMCFQAYNASSRLPKFLKCSGGIQHTFCLQCLRKLTTSGIIKCPTCRDLTCVAHSADSLKNNIYLMPQIEATASAAQLNQRLEMFCVSCVTLATEKCGEHELLRLSEIREVLRGMALKGAENTEAIKIKRSTTLDLYRQAYNVLAAAAKSVGRTIEDYDMDLQLDDDILRELERKREAIEFLPNEDLSDTFKNVESHISHTMTSLEETSSLARRCENLLDSSAEVSLRTNGSRITFAVGDWMRDENVVKALMGASIFLYSLDHMASSDDDEKAEAIGSQESNNVTRGNTASAQGGAVKAPSGISKAASASGDTGKPDNVSYVAGKSVTIAKDKANGKTSTTPGDTAGKTANGKTANGKAATKVNSVASDRATATANDSKVTSSIAASPNRSVKGNDTTMSNGPANDKAVGKATLTNKSASTGEAAKSSGTASGKRAVVLPDGRATGTVTVTSVSSHGANVHRIHIMDPVTGKAVSPATGAVSSGPAARKVTFSNVLKQASAPVEPAPARAAAVPRALRGDGRPYYRLQVTTGTDTGDVIIELRPDMAPIMCKNFISLCDAGLYNNTRFHFATANDYLLGGRVDDDEGFSLLADSGKKFIAADMCPLQDECGAIRMKGMGTVIVDGNKRGQIGSQFMIWVSEERDYRPYRYTLVFGYVRQGLDLVRKISTMDRPSIWRQVRLISAKRLTQ
ncbi:uncharacterized protein LOC119091909 isoform X2 [Pollicipes pollicipes]|nr:uncharacterized protein LOC119091909 isoform X2 [Pollicipes pollicipes]XP_037070732.1 uncharacterized protein LOC119091909 isoform X2 [Pollicipes pollicipes]